jgi:GNAT superfamily N-acetyltransferase
MNYRTATEADLTKLAQMRWDFRMEEGDELPVMSKPEFVKACAEFFKLGLDGGQYIYWIAEVDGEIISHVFIHKINLVPRPCKLKDQFGYVTNNYTKPAHRNKGVGSGLMKRAVDWAKDEDLELLIVYPSESALGFYQRAGFHPENDVMELRLREY